MTAELSPSPERLAEPDDPVRLLALRSARALADGADAEAGGGAPGPLPRRADLVLGAIVRRHVRHCAEQTAWRRLRGTAPVPAQSGDRELSAALGRYRERVRTVIAQGLAEGSLGLPGAPAGLPARAAAAGAARRVLAVLDSASSWLGSPGAPPEHVLAEAYVDLVVRRMLGPPAGPR
ncbi:hypothetical protein [Nocardiopsis potens]|uniref:hypothetical protein n=1 Tax=Nocardiopsis potens TaxID=1246458 RepID=UPI00034A5120|nr:hypothetical protein [Nocardiopsis potens]